MTRRFIPVSNWVEPLQGLAAGTQFATFGRHCLSYKVPLRTECFAMAVAPWSSPEILGETTAFMLRNRISVWLEKKVFSYAERSYELNCEAARQWGREHVRVTPRPPFVQWAFLSESRQIKSSKYLWHEMATAQDYLHLAEALDLHWDSSAFTGYSSQADL